MKVFWPRRPRLQRLRAAVCILCLGETLAGSPGEKKRRANEIVNRVPIGTSIQEDFLKLFLEYGNVDKVK